MVAVTVILEIVVVWADEAQESATGDGPPEAPPKGPRNGSILHNGNTILVRLVVNLFPELGS